MREFREEQELAPPPLSPAGEYTQIRIMAPLRVTMNNK
jgi:hypothetical protein